MRSPRLNRGLLFLDWTVILNLIQDLYRTQTSRPTSSLDRIPTLLKILNQVQNDGDDALLPRNRELDERAQLVDKWLRETHPAKVQKLRQEKDCVPIVA